MRHILKRRPSPAMVVALIALFIALGGVSYGVATGSINSREIKNSTVRSKDLRNNDIRGKDVRASTIGGSDVAANTLKGSDIDESSLGKVPSATTADGLDTIASAAAKGFATIRGSAANGAATVLNFGGQQTATDPPGVTAERQAAGTYLVTFRANTGGYSNAATVDDVAIQATGENFSNASAEATSVTQNVVVIRVRLRTFNGANPANEDFSVNFYTRPPAS